MRSIVRYGFLFFLLIVSVSLSAQDADTIFKWNVTSKKIADKTYELQFSTNGAGTWQLYAPNQSLSDVPTSEFLFADSSIQLSGIAKDSGQVKTIQSSIIHEAVKVDEGRTAWKQVI